MRDQLFTKRGISWVCVLFLVLGHLLTNAHPVLASRDGLGVSGSFASHHYVMVPGETMNASDVEVIFFNTTDSDMDLSLEGKGPLGIHFFFEKAQVTLKAKSSLTIPVSFRLSKFSAVRESEISVIAHILSKPGSGLSVNGFVQLNAKLSIMAQAADVLITLLDVRKQPTKAKLVLVRLNEDKSKTPIRDTDSGNLTERLVPGRYQVTAIKEGIIVASESFQLKDKEVLHLSLIARTISIPLFLAGPQHDSSGQIRNISIAYTLRNIDQVEKNVRMRLRYEKNGQLVEELEVMMLPELSVGESSGRLITSPLEGFSAGQYDLTLSLISGDGMLLATSTKQSVEVKAKALKFVLTDFSGWIAMVLVASVSLILFRKKTAIKS